MEAGEPFPTTDLVATLVSSALYATSTLLNSQDGGWAFDDGYGAGNGATGTNGTSILPGEDVMPPDSLDDGNYVLNTIVGIIIVISASALNAFGLNITKMDHVRTLALPRRERKEEYLRPLWLAGMGMYIISQLVGSTLALRWLRPDWVAPLGSTSLIFNFLFASWLVGTPVTATDIRGTAVIILGVILILVFSSINHGLQQGLNIERLNELWTRASWLAYFVFLVLFTSSTYFVSSLLGRLLASRASFSPLPSPSLPLHSRPAKSHAVIAFFKARWAQWKRLEDTALRHLETILQRADDPRLTWLQGVGWAVAGGSLAGVCLVFTKAVVKMLGLSGHPFIHPAPLLTILLTIFTAVLQIVCLNRALVCVDTVIVVPLFYAGYTVFGFINSLIFYDQVGQYQRWVLIAVFVSIAVLVAGVTILSLKSSAKSATDPYTVSTEPSGSMRMNPRPRQRMPSGTGAGAGTGASGGVGTGAGGEMGDGEGNNDQAGSSKKYDASGPGGEVMWEVGSVSSDEDEEDDVKRKSNAVPANGGGDGKGGREGTADGEEARRGIGGDGHGRGEKRGLLFDEDEDDEDEDGDGDGGRNERMDRIESAPGRGDVGDLREAERNPFAEDDDSVGAKGR